MNNQKDFNALKISVASPQQILSWSSGEVKKAETINYRTQRSEVDGLFCEKIFGPTKNYECYCGKYKKIRYKGIICDKCGVEVTHKRVRRERMGHIKLASPAVHIWFSHGVPNQLALVLGMPAKKLSSVIYFSRYAVVSSDNEKKLETLAKLENNLEDHRKELYAERDEQIKALDEEMAETAKALKKGKEADKSEFKIEQHQIKSKRNIAKVREEYARREQQLDEEYRSLKDLIESIEVRATISEEEYVRLIDEDATDFFVVKMGADAIKHLLLDLDLQELSVELRKDLNGKSQARKKKAVQRLRIIEGLIKTGTKPEWFVMEVLPVIPPELRPIIQLAGGRYATSDLNDLYRRVINRNNRLNRLMDLGAPDIILRNEKRMLQESVDALIDNQHRPGTPVLNGRRMPYKSLADMLRGKKGRFRQNLLGKRVDYSGRGVIIAGPELKLTQCGLPKDAALELFRPFVLREIIKRDLAPNIRSAKSFFEEQGDEVWDILEDVIKDRPVLLNRAPTLHKQGIQAFYPTLIEGKAIKIHPMICTGFNADFDGDQMAVHVPLSKQAVEEAKKHMFTDSNIIYQSDASTVIEPAQDIILGCYYLTAIDSTSKKTDFVFANASEAITAYEQKNIGLKDEITVRINGKYIETTVGRVIFNEILPEGYAFENIRQDKKSLRRLVAQVMEQYREKRAIEFLDTVKALGFKYATESGFSIAMDDCGILPERERIISDAEKEEAGLTENYMMGLITYAEKRRLTEKVWLEATNKIADDTWSALGGENSVVQMVESGARGSKDQIKQISGMRGLLLDPTGHFVEVPIKSNFKMGLSSFEYFIGARGTRKGLADTALKTSESGYLTRRLVDVSSDVIIATEDCGSEEEGFELRRDDTRRIDFGDRLVGRWTGKDVIDNKGKVVLEKNTEITKEVANKLAANENVEVVVVRSPLTCRADSGICAKCYGYSMSSLKPAQHGIAVGVVAAQAMGEAATQLTLDTFHYAGAVSTDITQGLPRVEELFEARTPKSVAIISEIDGKVTLIENDGGEVETVRVTKEMKEEITFDLEDGDEPMFKKTKTLKSGETIYKRANGEEVRAEGQGKAMVQEGKIVFNLDHIREKEYRIELDTELLVANGDEVIAGQALTKGAIDPKDLLTTAGLEKTQKYIIDNIQETYSNQGIALNDKHTEVIVRQMSRFVRILNPGDSEYAVGDYAPRLRVINTNEELREKNLQPIVYKDKLLGITMSSLKTESWLSATSFERQVQVLTDAAIQGKIDYLRGLKENVMIGRLIPVREYAVGERFDNADETEADTVE